MPSPNTNAGGGVWNFDTSSGGNEDWIVAPLQDGLHEFLQHNVLFDGDKIDVPFTTTLGTLHTLLRAIPRPPEPGQHRLLPFRHLADDERQGRGRGIALFGPRLQPL